MMLSSEICLLRYSSIIMAVIRNTCIVIEQYNYDAVIRDTFIEKQQHIMLSSEICLWRYSSIIMAVIRNMCIEI